ncbi:MAG TPA: hypothetical protein VJ689_05760, partial [Gaiellaceae bacterium]|nr:hypothetical protein [Gaiellaceae bacterium]
AAEPGARRDIASTASLLRLAVSSCWRGPLTPRFRRSVRLDIPPAFQGRVTIAARITASANPGRGTVLLKRP